MKPMSVREGSDDNDMDDAPMMGKKKGKKMCAACKAGKSKNCDCMKEKAMKDGECGMKKDSLTPREYLAACDLGIQRRSTTYIRARLDTAKALSGR